MFVEVKSGSTFAPEGSYVYYLILTYDPINTANMRFVEFYA